MCNSIRNLLRRVSSLCIFPTFSKFLKNLSACLEYRTFRLGAFIVIFTGCVHFYIFKGALGTNFRNLSKKKNFFLPNIAGWSIWLATCFISKLWTAALIGGQSLKKKRTRKRNYLHEISKICNFLFPNNNK